MQVRRELVLKGRHDLSRTELRPGEAGRPWRNVYGVHSRSVLLQENGYSIVFEDMVAGRSWTSRQVKPGKDLWPCRVVESSS
eukprot:1157161-Pelagomonas_calceolata.AAC.4